jgi:hypothetical protein
MGLDSGKDRPDPGMSGGIICSRPEMHRCKKRAEEDDAKTGKAFIYLFQTVARRLAAFSGRSVNPSQLIQLRKPLLLPQPILAQEPKSLFFLRRYSLNHVESNRPERDCFSHQKARNCFHHRPEKVTSLKS